MAHPRAIIAEDEEVLREELRGHLNVLWPELDIVAMASNGIEALSLFDRHRPDILFLDIQMPGLTGLDVARQIEGRCHMVFVTAYDVYAMAAFERGVADYLLKPYEPARLMLALRRIRQSLDSRQAVVQETVANALPVPSRDYLRWINVSKGSGVQLITVEEICYFQADTKYTRVVTAEGESLIRRSLKELSEQLDPGRFWQIHRSTIVNVDAIAGVTRNLAGGVQVKLKSRLERLDVSEGHRHLFRQM